MNDNTYKLKWSNTALVINPESKFSEIQSLATEMDYLALDTTKNEKIGFIFRAIKTVNGEHVIYDTSCDCQLYNEKVITGQQMLQFAEDYYHFVSREVEPNLLIELTYYYYPLDKTNKVEEISEEGKYVTYCVMTNLAEKVFLENFINTLTTKKQNKSKK